MIQRYIKKGNEDTLECCHMCNEDIDITGDVHFIKIEGHPFELEVCPKCAKIDDPEKIASRLWQNSVFLKNHIMYIYEAAEKIIFNLRDKGLGREVCSF